MGYGMRSLRVNLNSLHSLYCLLRCICGVFGHDGTKVGRSVRLCIIIWDLFFFATVFFCDYGTGEDGICTDWS